MTLKKLYQQRYYVQPIFKRGAIDEDNEENHSIDLILLEEKGKKAWVKMEACRTLSTKLLDI